MQRIVIRARWMRRQGDSVKDIASKLGRSRRWVSTHTSDVSTSRKDALAQHIWGLSEMDGLSIRQISAKLSMNRRTVAKQIDRINQQLQKLDVEHYQHSDAELDSIKAIMDSDTTNLFEIQSAALPIQLSVLEISKIRDARQMRRDGATIVDIVQSTGQGDIYDWVWDIRAETDEDYEAKVIHEAQEKGIIGSGYTENEYENDEYPYIIPYELPIH